MANKKHISARRNKTAQSKEELGWVVPAAAAAGALATAAANAYKANRDSKKGRNANDATIQQFTTNERIESKKLDVEQLHNTQKTKLSKWLILLGALVAIYGIKKGTEMYKQWKKEEEATKAYKGDINEKDIKLRDSDFENIIKKIILALDRANVDENSFYNEINKLSNASEWNKLVALFGLYKSTANSIAVGNGFKAFEGNLVDWTLRQFSESEINQKIRPVLYRIGAQI